MMSAISLSYMSAIGVLYKQTDKDKGIVCCYLC